MPRRLRNLLLLLPVVLLFLTLYASARSYLPKHTHFRSHRGKLLMIFASGNEEKWFVPGNDSFKSNADLIFMVQRYAVVRRAPQGKLLGVEWIGTDGRMDRPCMIMIPYWYIATPLAIASAWSAIVLRRRRIREKPGHCNACGYDLRASHEKCPECGTPAISTATSTNGIG